MKLAVMQPYFLPYLGYFDLINHVEKWIVFDTAQFSKGGWYNRNRILHPNTGWQYITVPLAKYSMGSPIVDVNVHPSIDWRSRILGQLVHYRDRNAPFYSSVVSLLQDCLNCRQTSLARLNVHCLQRVCSHIGIEMNDINLSELDCKKTDNETPAEYILRICIELGATEYVNLPGGVNLYSVSEFLEKGVTLTLRDLPLMSYETPGYQFESGLSIVDVLMWNRPQSILEFLKANEEIA